LYIFIRSFNQLNDDDDDDNDDMIIRDKYTYALVTVTSNTAFANDVRGAVSTRSPTNALLI